MPDAAGDTPTAEAAPRPPIPDDGVVHDVLVVGGGPSGSACAYWLADAGWDVVVVEKKHFPRDKTCGDGLTPRSVRQLADMGLEGALTGAHRFDGLRSCAYGMSMDLRWPDHPSFPSHGYVITRHDLDQIVSERAVKAGAVVWEGAEAVTPLLADTWIPADTSLPADAPVAAPGAAARSGAGSAGSGPATGSGGLPACVGAVVRDLDHGGTVELRARYVVVCDGANSRFGRSLGTTRDRSYPMGMALRGYYRSPRHDDTFIESHLDIRDRSGKVVPGYGWIFPLGDGRVNVGVGLLSVEGRWKGVNTSHLMDAFVDFAPDYWELSPAASCGAATGGKLPMGLSVAPRVGPTTLVVGDASGAINPFNGEGIAYAYETGRLAAACLGRALAGEGAAAVADYPRLLDDAYGLYYRVARDFVRMISSPEVMRACVQTGMHSKSIMGWLLRIMANLLRPDEVGPAEAAYRAMATMARSLQST